MMVVRCAVVFACLFALLGAGPALGDSFTELKDDLDQLRKDAGVAGALVMIVDKDGIRHAAGLGVTHWDQPEPMHPDVWIRIGSITKAFVGMAFVRLEGEGELSLTDTLAALNADRWVQNPWAQQHPVTIAQLLEHSAGLTDMVREEWDHNVPLPLTEALKVAPESRRLKWPPGVHSSYSNSGAGVAAAAMEEHLKRDFESYLTDQVLRPLGMDEATFSAAVKPELIGGYDRDGKTPIRYWHMLYRPFGALNLPFAELSRWLRLMLGEGVLDGKRHYTAEQLRRMENPATTAAAGGGLVFGYGLGNYHQVHRGFVFHGHGGDADGYLTHCAYNRDAGLGFCVLINAFQGSTLRAMRRRVMDFVVDGLTPSYTPGVPQPMAHLESLTGRYTQVTQRFPGSRARPSLEVTLRDGRLMLVRSSGEQHLVPLSRWHFRRRFEPVATTAFIP
ncbi:MAG: serine hydrolase domain-containing protein, partial [Pseudomonadota bacterium]